jgi:heptaprenyl diphosphate synthase
MRSLINCIEKTMFDSAEHTRTYKIAILVSIASVLQISESFIPHPIPGLRLGLANMLTLVALVTLGFRAALEISILRTVLSAFVMGTFMSPAFILSLLAAVVSSLVMGFFYWLSGFHGRYRLSLIGISILGALSHNMVQLFLAYLLLVRHRGIFVFAPWLCLGAVFMGLITGVVARKVCIKLREAEKLVANAETTQKDSYAPGPTHYVAGTSFLHRLKAETKISALLILSLPLFIFSNLWFYLVLILFLMAVLISSRTPMGFLFTKIRRYWFFVLISFSFPLLFDSGKRVLIDAVYFQITQEALSTGAVFAFRILFLLSLSALLVRTTAPEELTNGLARVLSPLKYFGLSERWVARTLSLSWSAMPLCWEAVRKAIRTSNVRGVKNLSNLIPALVQMIATLYREAAPESAWIQQGKSLGSPEREL